MRTTTDPLSPDLLRAPIDGDRSSGYRHVYYRGTDLQGRTVWAGKVKIGTRVYPVPDSRARHPRDSARAVARWYFERYGSDWPKHLNRSHKWPWAARRSESRGGWCARVWVQGEPVEVPAVRWRGGVCRFRRGTLGVWRTKREAVRAARRFLWWLLGYMQDELAFRCEECANMQAARVPVTTNLGGKQCGPCSSVR